MKNIANIDEVIKQQAKALADLSVRMKRLGMDTDNIPAENFIATIKANVDNEKLSDENFREFIRNSLDIVLSGGDILQDYIEYRKLSADLVEFILTLRKIEGI